MLGSAQISAQLDKETCTLGVGMYFGQSVLGQCIIAQFGWSKNLV